MHNGCDTEPSPNTVQENQISVKGPDQCQRVRLIEYISSGKDVLEDINGAVKGKDHFTQLLKPALNMYLP